MHLIFFLLLPMVLACGLLYYSYMTKSKWLLKYSHLIVLPLCFIVETICIVGLTLGTQLLYESTNVIATFVILNLISAVLFSINGAEGAAQRIYDRDGGDIDLINNSKARRSWAHITAVTLVVGLGLYISQHF